MCLTKLTTKKPKVAKKDITCYKVLRDDLVSAYQRHPYILGCKELSEIERDEYGRVDVGLHSFVSKEDAQGDLAWWTSYRKSNPEYLPLPHIICQCIIPKGAKYYLGKFDDSGDCHASNELIVLKKL